MTRRGTCMRATELLLQGVHRGNTHAQLAALVAATNLSVATLSLGRNVFPEMHPNHVGVFAGSRSFPPAVKQLVEGSDCLICVGANLSDWNTGGFTADLDERNMVVRCTAFLYVNNWLVLPSLPRFFRRISN